MHDTLTHSYTSSPLLRLTCAKGSSVAQEVMDTHIHTQKNTHTCAQDTDTHKCWTLVKRTAIYKLQIYSFSMALQDANDTVFSCHSWIQLPRNRRFPRKFTYKAFILQLNSSTFNSVWERNPLKLVAVFSAEIALAWLSFKLILECMKQLAVVFLELGSVSRLIDGVVWMSLRQRQS